MIRISQLKIPVGHSEEALYRELVRQAHGRKPKSWHIVRRSIDARKKPKLFYVYTIDAEFDQEKKLLSGKKSRWAQATSKAYVFPHENGRTLCEEERPVIVGAGPAGLFAGLVLARAGFAPILFERGDSVARRTEVVESFFSGGALDEESNVQFGEGGAGTFSDGKLNTLVKDKFGRNHFVLREFVRHGAPEDILYEAKPHIGTDILKNVVAAIREEIESLGGEIHFRTKVCDLLVEKGQVAALVTEHAGARREHACRHVIFAVGHSARDTFLLLKKRGLFMTPKAFAIGVRVEHPAALINESQYGVGCPAGLPTASYKLTHQCKGSGRGIYSFCMCPGGYVVNSSSERGHLCVNGMSYHDRSGQNSNTALITTVTPNDFPSDDPLAGIEFQRRYERLAYETAAGKIPVQLYGDFRRGERSRVLGGVTPSIKGDFALSNLRECLPGYVCDSLLEGMEAFGRKIAGYDRADALFSGVETRTSSPLRMERGKDFEGSIEGLFPCGEGAGYAGGITSAAMDGVKTAEAVAGKILMDIGKKARYNNPL